MTQQLPADEEVLVLVNQMVEHGHLVRVEGTNSYNLGERPQKAGQLADFWDHLAAVKAARDES